jgi:predicted DNA-binding transcriptional regulator AlpA
MTEDKKDETWDYMYNDLEQDELLLKTEAVSEMVGLAKTTLEHMRLKAVGPKFVHIGGEVQYRLSEIHTWMKEHESYDSTGDATVKKKVDS